MSAAKKLPSLTPFPGAATGVSAQMMFVRSDARFIDLWEESSARTTYARDLAEVLAQAQYGAGGPGPNAIPAVTGVICHLLSEAQVFEGLAYAAARRERDAGGDA